MKLNQKKEKGAHSALSSLLKSIIDIPAVLAFVLALISFSLLIYVFVTGKEDEAIAYISYPLSAYALIVLCYKARRIKEIITWIKSYEIAQDGVMRAKYMLISSLIYNGIYIALKVAVGFIFHQEWLIGLALYYFLVFLMKMMLLIDRKRQSVNTPLFIGVFLIAMSFPLSFIAAALLESTYSFSYPGYLIYVFALYSFSFFSSSLYSFIKHRKSTNLNYISYRTLSFALACVSLMSLQSAMFSSFSTTEDEAFMRTMNAILPFFVIIFIALLGVYLIRLSARAKREAQNVPQK